MKLISKVSRCRGGSWIEVAMVKTYERTCDECGKEYRGVGVRYCSWECYINSRWTECICQDCGKEFKARKVWVNRGQMKYCSVECSSLASRRFPVIDYEGDRFYFRTNGGYYVSTKTGRKLQRVIWESEHGPIPQKHVIHHKDGDTTNNELENLALLEWGAHTSLHHKGKAHRQRPKKICGIEDCDRETRARGLCGMHYQRVRAKEKRDEART